jgi:hypothetical protein
MLTARVSTAYASVFNLNLLTAAEGMSCLWHVSQAVPGSMGAGGLLVNTASMHGGPTTSLAQPPGMSRLMPAKLDFADLTAAAEASNLMPAISLDSRSRLPSDLAGDGGG